MMGDTKAASDMLTVKTSTYRPPAYYKPTFLQYGLPPFTLATVEWMRRDPQVRLGMGIKLAPYSVVKLTLKGDPEVTKFIGNQIRRFWSKAIPKITKAFWYTRSGGEIVYKYIEGRYEFWNYYDVYPTDCSVLMRHGVPCGVSIKPSTGVNDPNQSSGANFSTLTNPQNSPTQARPLRLLFPKGFLYLHGREFNSLDGQSEFEAAYESWLEKTDAQGGKHSRKLWFYKNAFSGGILLHPPGSYIDERTNEAIPYEVLARQALETSLNGAVWTFAQQYDPITKMPMWQFIEPKINPGGESVLQYVSHLDNEIMRGMGIPDDVVQQVSGTGSYAGRSIPLMAFFISQRTTLVNLFNVCDEQVFRPLCRANFGHDKYEAVMEVDVERMMGEMQEGSDQGNLRPSEATYASEPSGNPPANTNQNTQFSTTSIVNKIHQLASGVTEDTFDASVRIVYLS